MSFFTCRCDFPQKLHRSCSLESVGRATQSEPPQSGRGYRRNTPSTDGSLLVMGNNAVDDVILLRLIRAHEVVALRVAGDLLEILAGVLGENLVEPLAHVDDLLGMDLDVGRLALKGR